MPAILHAPPPVFTPAEILKTAVRWARAQGWTIRLGSLGVAAVSTHGGRRWERDEHDPNPGTDPLGCLILQAQPPAMDAERGAAVALRVDLCWVVGFNNGLNLQPKASGWVSSPKRRNYLNGYEVGVTFRIWLLSTGNAS